MPISGAAVNELDGPTVVRYGVGAAGSTTGPV